jgi:hypothetical protein
MQYQIVRLTWHDAHSVGSGWQSIDEIDDDACVVESVGILLPESKDKHVVLCQSITDTDSIDHILAVPVAMVVHLQVLSELSVGSVSPSQPT